MDRKVLHQLSYGVYAITTLDGMRPAGCIANSVMQVTSQPPTVAVSINHRNHTNPSIVACGRFALSICPETADPAEIGALGFSSSRDGDKFSALRYKLADGLPVLEDAVSYGLFKVVDRWETATHTVFLGEMYNSAQLADGKPMTYAYYHEVFRGTSPSNAPTYEAPTEPGKKEADMSGKKVWRCTICGYIYDGETPFEELPADWTCPLCGAGKDRFEEVDA